MRQPLALARLVQAATQMAELVGPGVADLGVIGSSTNRDATAVGKPVGGLLVELADMGSVDIELCLERRPASVFRSSSMPRAGRART